MRSPGAVQHSWPCMHTPSHAVPRCHIKFPFAMHLISRCTHRQKYGNRERNMGCPPCIWVVPSLPCSCPLVALVSLLLVRHIQLPVLLRCEAPPEGSYPASHGQATRAPSAACAGLAFSHPHSCACTLAAALVAPTHSPLPAPILPACAIQRKPMPSSPSAAPLPFSPAPHGPARGQSSSKAPCHAPCLVPCPVPRPIPYALCPTPMNRAPCPVPCPPP